MITRRTAPCDRGGCVFCRGHAAVAAQPVVEVLAMKHSPVQSAFKPVRDLLAKYQTQGKLRVVESTSKAPRG